MSISNNILGIMKSFFREEIITDIFRGRPKPLIDFYDAYVDIFKYLQCEEILPVAILYIEKISKTYAFNGDNIARARIASFVISLKYMDDWSPKNSEISKLVELNTRDISIMEQHILSLLDWNLWVEKEDYDRIVKLMIQGLDGISPPELT